MNGNLSTQSTGRRLRRSADGSVPRSIGGEGSAVGSLGCEETYGSVVHVR